MLSQRYEAVFDWRSLSERKAFRNNTEKSHEYIETIAFMGSETLEKAEVPDSGQDAWMLMEE